MMSKTIGISPMIVSDVIKELRDDDLIEEEKVGASSFYWCFESKLKVSMLTIRLSYFITDAIS